MQGRPENPWPPNSAQQLRCQKPPTFLQQQDSCAGWLMSKAADAPGCGRTGHQACPLPARPQRGHTRAHCSVRSASCPETREHASGGRQPANTSSSTRGCGSVHFPLRPERPPTLDTLTHGCIVPAAGGVCSSGPGSSHPILSLPPPSSACPHPPPSMTRRGRKCLSKGHWDQDFQFFNSLVGLWKHRQE